MFNLAAYPRETIAIVFFLIGLWAVGVPSGFWIACIIGSTRRAKDRARRDRDASKLHGSGKVVDFRDKDAMNALNAAVLQSRWKQPEEYARNRTQQ